MNEPQATFVVEYPCDWHCSGEFDLTGIPDRYPYGRMLRAVDDVHQQLHRDGGSQTVGAAGAITVVGRPAPADLSGAGAGHE